MTKKILIIEDEDILSGMYADRFRLEGWNVNVAATRDDGLEITKREEPDIVLLDILLFNGHGIEYLRIKKQTKRLQQFRLLFFLIWMILKQKKNL